MINYFIFVKVLKLSRRMKPIIQRSIKLGKIEYNEKHLSIVSCLIDTGLTKKEIEVLATFLSLDKSLTEDNMFNTEARRIVRKKLNFSYGGLGNHLRSILDKGVLVKNEKTNIIKLREFLLPMENMQGYRVILEKEKDENK